MEYQSLTGAYSSSSINKLYHFYYMTTLTINDGNNPDVQSLIYSKIFFKKDFLWTSETPNSDIFS